MSVRKRSLSLAREYRTCPPEAVKNDPAQIPLYRIHRSRCPYCSAHDDSSPPKPSPWDALARKLGEIAASSAPPKEHAPPPEPGQLRYISPDLAHWREGFFYNPPLVLLLRRIHIPFPHFMGAMTYFDPPLAGPGDLILPPERSGIGQIFIQTWHPFPVFGAHLGDFVATLSPEIRKAAAAMEKDPDHLPSWGLAPMPMREDDPRGYFRAIEKDAERTFSEAAFGTLHHESEAIPLAAADRKEAGEPILANLVQRRGSRVDLVSVVPGVIWDRVVLEGGISIDGRLSDLPKDLSGSRLIAFLKPRNGYLRSPDSVHWEEDHGLFLIFFPAPANEDPKVLLKASLHLAVFNAESNGFGEEENG